MPAFTNTQLTHFFTANTQMGLTTVQKVALVGEGSADVTDFADFKDNEIKMAPKNVRQGNPAILGIPAIPEQRNLHGTITQAAIPVISWPKYRGFLLC